jgi:hypothetical protein
MQDNLLDGDSAIEFLVDDVADRYPQATVEFKDVSFVANHIHGSIKRLLPADRSREIHAERDGRNSAENQGFERLHFFVARTMREVGKHENASLFVTQVSEVIELLISMGARDAPANDCESSVMTGLIEDYEANGRAFVEERIVNGTIEELALPDE